MKTKTWLSQNGLEWTEWVLERKKQEKKKKNTLQLEGATAETCFSNEMSETMQFNCEGYFASAMHQD